MPFPRRTALLALLAALGVAPARAQDVYLSRADFLAAFAGQTATNSLDPFDVSGGGLNPVPGIAFGAVTGTLSAPAAPLTELNFANFSPGLSWIVADGGVSQLQLSRAVSGVGVDFFDLGTNGDVVFRLFDSTVGSTPVATIALSAIPGFDPVGGNGFLGFGSAIAFDLVEVEAVAGEFFELDDPIVAGPASAVPEPATGALVAGGVALVALAERGRRRRVRREG